MQMTIEYAQDDLADSKIEVVIELSGDGDKVNLGSRFCHGSEIFFTLS